jgi:hypothetical protein
MKRKQPFSLNQFIRRQYGLPKKKKTKNVYFCDFAPMLPREKTENLFEQTVYKVVAQIVFNLLMKAFGLQGEEGRHYRCHGSLNMEGIDEDTDFHTSNFTMIFETAWKKNVSDDWLVWDESTLIEDLVMIIATSFIHGTPFLSRIKRFQRNIDDFSIFLSQQFFTDDFCLTVEAYVLEEYKRRSNRWEEVDTAAFQMSGWSYNVSHLFLLVLESAKSKLLGIIEELEFLCEPSHVASVEDRIQKQVWEVLVCDWVDKWGEQEDYIRLYESEGALRWFLDFVIPERIRVREYLF